MKIEELNLSVRTSNALRRAGVRTTEQLETLEATDLLKLRGFGQCCLKEIQGILDQLHKQEAERRQEGVAANGTYLHGYQEGKEAMRRAVIKEMTRMARHLTGEQKDAISEACGLVKMIEVL